MRTLSFLKILALSAVLLVGGISITKAAEKGGSFTVGNKTFLLNGKPFVVKAAELHYPRIPRPYWEHRIKMCRALGMNTICLYVFWNIHEQREGEFGFTGQNDIAEFCRLAQKNGMYVIVRPGPYVCAEWEMGGLPWWLLKKKDIRLREQDPYFMERVEKFMGKVGEQLAPLTIQRGGPIIMVQVENEYGSYGEDKAYVSAIRDIVRRSGFDEVTLFQCDWASNFTLNGLDDLVWTMNFGTGSNIDDQFRHLRELRPESPLMCSEFWSGWFDKWGASHETRPADAMTAGIDEMLSKGISFSLYMTHGGTSFGHWAGANSPGFAPDVTSYDYDAPINEYGHAMPKYYLLREVMAKYADGKLPAVPKPVASLVTVDEFTISDFTPLAAGIDSTASNRTPLTFEEMDMGWGTMIYTTSLPEVPTNSVLTLDGAHDYAQVYVNGKYVGKADRVRNENTVVMPPTAKGDVMTVVVEGMGRINFGRAIKDPKGLTGQVTLRATVDGDDVTWNLKDWTMHTVPLSTEDTSRQATSKQALSLDTSRQVTSKQACSDTRKSPCLLVSCDLSTKKWHAPGYYRGTFNVKKVGDTFLNMETWGKGMVYVNGHAIGRFWSIGPQQTLYVPGCWLKKGSNEIVVLDVVGPKQTRIWGQDKPELDKLQLETGNRHNNPGDRPDLNSATPAATGTFASGKEWQTVKFASAATGRYIAIECVNGHSGDVVSMAEVYALDADGKRIDRNSWATKYADSEDADNGNHTGDKAFDLQESTFWRTTEGSALPHLLVIDMGKQQTVSGIEYLPCITQDDTYGIKDYKIYIY